MSKYKMVRGGGSEAVWSSAGRRERVTGGGWMKAYFAKASKALGLRLYRDEKGRSGNL